MSIENRLIFPSREKVAKAALATLVVTLPLAGFFARKELSLQNTKNKQQALAEKTRQEAIKASQDSNDSGDSGFIFPRGI